MPSMNIERAAIEDISRQSLHGIINKLSAHILDYDRRSTAYYVGQLFTKPFRSELLVEKPTSKMVARLLTPLTKIKGMLDRLDDYYREAHTNKLCELVWQISTGNVDNQFYRKHFKVSSVEAIFDSNLIKLMQMRYRRLRGLDRDQMQTHAAYFLIMRRGIQSYYDRDKPNTREDWDRLSPQELDLTLKRCAIYGLMYVIFILQRYPIRDAKDPPTGWD